EVSAVPPLPGINLHVEYIDPENVYPVISPNNTRDGSINPASGCVQFDPGSGSIFSESHNGSLLVEGYHKLWSQHDPYAGDYRTLGDNWNYHINDVSEIEEHNVPWCDPIRTHNPDPPCFWNCVGAPGQYCLDQFCQKGKMTVLKTNKHGKYGVYFDTKAHGGDNFQFRAYAPTYFASPNDCLEAIPNTKFTVWRKIYLDYVWMTDRNGQYPACTGSTYYEYKGIHDINNGNFDRIINTYDDCFIEIEPVYHYLPNSPYQFAIWWWGELVTYGDQTGFRPAELDHVMLLGVDHLNHVLPDNCGGLLGLSVPYWWLLVPDDDAYYNYTAVGYYQDGATWGEEFFLDRVWDGNTNKHILNTSAHELGHCLSTRSFPMDNEKDYGLMNDSGPGFDTRSYFHEDHIIALRSASWFDDPID
ncbi:MAG: hypothetical protein ABIG42_10865, partial [bacterium]